MASIKIDNNKCNLCGECIPSCPFEAMDQVGDVIEISAACKMCKLCIKACPTSAIVITQSNTSVNKDEWQGVLVYAEYFEGKVHPVTYELIGIGRKLASEVNMKTYCLLIGHDMGTTAQELLEYGVDKVFVYDNAKLDRFCADTYANVLQDIITELKPSIVLVGSTSIGRSLAPRVSTRFKTGLTADCTTLDRKSVV